jgi:hypothetical protein
LKSLAYIAVGLHFIAPVQGNEIGGWEFGESVVQGARIHSAALLATQAIASGSSPDYPPVYSLSCTEGDPIHWKHQVQLQEALSSRGLISVSQSIDDGDEQDRGWTVTGNKRAFTRFDVPLAHDLAYARSLKLAWNWGWSWLWIGDEAHFDLTGIRSVTYTLAKKCGVPQP